MIIHKLKKRRAAKVLPRGAHFFLIYTTPCASIAFATFIKPAILAPIT